MGNPPVQNFLHQDTTAETVVKVNSIETLVQPAGFARFQIPPVKKFPLIHAENGTAIANWFLWVLIHFFILSFQQGLHCILLRGCKIIVSLR